MAVSITWSQSAGGAAQSDPYDLGIVDAGTTAGLSTVFIRHDGAFEITDCSFYIQPYAGPSYEGNGTPQSDYDLMLTWGDRVGVDGGLEVDQGSGWEHYNSTQGVASTPFVLTCGTGTNPDDIAIGLPGEVSVDLRILVPAAGQPLVVPGYVFFDHCLKYTYTS